MSEIIGFTQLISEGRSFKNEFPRMKKYLDNNHPVMVGALDMYYLHYYPDLYKREHIPIHYILLVGYDDKKKVVFVHDCSFAGIQEVPYEEFASSLDVNVPGLSKKNTWRVFNIPDTLIAEQELAQRGLVLKAHRMLSPPVRIIGIPAMRKLAEEITAWTDEECYRHMAAYAGLTPPLVSEDLSRNDGMRFELARVMPDMGLKYNHKAWVGASHLFVKSGKMIIELCAEAVKRNVAACSSTLNEIAATEEEAYNMMLQ